ncbi:hypothetical protein P3W45_000439 [Vairimorpha bombi]|jgi:hypothetical protein
MANFYSQTLEILSKFIKAVSKKNKSPLNNLQEYIRIVGNISENTAEHTILQNCRMNLLDDLRFLIIINLKSMDRGNRRHLKSFHSALHLITLLNKKKLSSYYIINEWLNSNIMLRDENDVLHAMRGNLGKLIKNNPLLRESIEELCVIESHLRTGKITEQKYLIVKEEWVRKYESKLPTDIKDILIGKKVKIHEHWTEILCYKLSYGNKNCSIEDILNQIKDEIPVNDEIYLILKEDYKKLMENSSGWIKLIYCFLFDSISRREIYDSITEIATKLIDIDWQIALDYFSFTAFSNYYFDKICSDIDMNPVIFDFLHRYAKRNNLELSSLLEIYMNYLLQKKDFYNYCIFVNSYKLTNFVVQNDFVHFLLTNFSSIEIFLTDDFKNSDLGKYVVLFNNIITKDNSPKKEDLEYLFSHSFTPHCFFILLGSIVVKENPSEGLLIKCLDLLFNKEKDLLVDKKDITSYKIKLVDKLHSCSLIKK